MRFEGLPDIEEEEKQYLSRQKLAKDAKLGAEIENEWKIKQDEENWAPEEDISKIVKKNKTVEKEKPS